MDRSNGDVRADVLPLKSDGSSQRLLIVGAQQTLPKSLQGMLGSDVAATAFSDLDEGVLQKVDPDIVLAPLFSSQFDITDLAAHLVRLGYRGMVRAYTRPLPAPKIVAQEMEQVNGVGRPLRVHGRDTEPSAVLLGAHPLRG